MSRAFLLDSDVLIDFLNGNRSAITFLSAMKDDNLAMSLLSFGEVLTGDLKKLGMEEAKERLNAVFRGIEILPVSEQTIERFASLGSILRQRGNAIAQIDLLIAATALEHKRVLVTRNIRHFDRVPGLEILLADIRR